MYDSVFGSYPDPAWVYDAVSLRFLDVNAAAVLTYGYTRDEFLAMSIADIRPPEDIAALLEHVSRAPVGLDLSGVWRHRLKDGRIIHVDIRSNSVKHDGRAARLVVVRDVTDRVLLEEQNKALLESERAARKRAEESADLLRIAGQSARLGGWRINLLNGIADWSDVTANIRGAIPITTSTLAEALNVYAPEHREIIRSVFNRCAESGAAFDETVQIVSTNDRRVWVRVIGEAFRNAEGMIIGVHGALQDVSELVSAQEASSKSEQRLRETLDNMGEGFMTLDQEWRCTYVNRETVRLLDRPAEAMLGQLVFDIFPHGRDSPFQRKFRSAIAENAPIAFVEYFAPIARWFEVSVSPSSGELAVYLRDVTHTRAQQEQLQLLETAVSRLNDIVLITDAEPISEPGPRIVFVNNAFERRTGYKREEVIGRSPRFLQGPQTDRAELDRIGAALRDWKPVRAELINYTKAGEPFWLELDIVPIADESGWFTHWVSVERDVTERHRMEEQLRQSQRLEGLGQLTGGVAHDFNNLLTVILGNAAVLEEELSEDQHLGVLAQLTRKAADRGAALTSRLLSFSRRQTLDPKPTNISELLGGMHELLRRTLAGEIEIETIATPDLWACLIDASQLENALLNLSINARDAMPSGGKLTIETANIYLDATYIGQNMDVEEGGYVLVAVSDTGVGMDEQTIARAFEPFFTTKDVGKGSGLGLSMVYGFVKQSRGHIKIYSEVGQGTTVKLYLPRTAADAVPLARDVDVGELPHGDEKILLVEDDDMVRDHATAQLSMLGYTVVAVRNGAAGIKALEEIADFDLLFTDVVMPGGINGPQLAMEAKRLRPGLPVLYTSGYTENAIVHHGRLDAGVHLLNKPYRLQELAQIIRLVLGG